MQLASFFHDGRSTYGVVVDGVAHTLPAPVYARHPALKDALAADALPEIAAAGPESPVPAPGWLPPIPNPSKIFCIGVNYLPHIREMGREPPEKPLVFMRCANSLVGHGQALVAPEVSEQYDYEGELALVIGQPCRRVSRERAFDVIAGFMPFMDGSVRDFQRHTTQFTAGKNFWRSGAAGPALVTADEVGDVRELTLETRLNGNVMQSASVGDLLFDIPSLVAYCTSFASLEPGDIIETGTPGGVGAARTPPVWLQPGDSLAVDLGPAGTLENPVVAESDIEL